MGAEAPIMGRLRRAQVAVEGGFVPLAGQARYLSLRTITRRLARRGGGGFVCACEQSMKCRSADTVRGYVKKQDAPPSGRDASRRAAGIPFFRRVVVYTRPFRMPVVLKCG